MSTRSDRGFTLLEVLVSITIAGTVFVVLMSGFGANMKNIGLAEDYTTAAFLAKEVMTGFETEGIKPGKSEGDFGETYDRFRWVADVEEDGEKPFYRATLKVIFERGAVEREFEVKTVFLTKKEDGGKAEK